MNQLEELGHKLTDRKTAQGTYFKCTRCNNWFAIDREDLPQPKIWLLHTELNIEIWDHYGAKLSCRELCIKDVIM